MNKILTTFGVIVLCLGLTAAFVLGKPESRTPKNDSKETKSTKSSKTAKTAWLGVMTQTVDEDIADAFDVDVDHGAIVNQVIENSPAENADIEEGDVIVSFNGKKVWDENDLTDFVEDAEVGSTAAVGIIRDGKEMTINIELGSRPKGVSWSSNNGRTPGTFFFNGPDNTQLFNWGGKGGYIGVQLSELTKQLGTFLGVPDGEGVLITEVSEDSPAEKAGLKAGDVITAIDGDEVSEYGEVKEIVSETDEGETLAVTIVRDKKSQKVNVVVEESDGRNEFGYQFFQAPSIPNVPDIDVQVPRVRGNFNRDHSAYFDYDNYKEDMERFKADMEKYKEEMKALSKDMKRMKGSDQTQLEREIEELRAKLSELEKKIQ